MERTVVKMECREIDWRRELSNAVTKDDFEAIKEHIPFMVPVDWVFSIIKTPEVLDACLQYLQHPLDRCIEVFYIVARDLRIDLLEVFWAGGYLTTQDLLRTRREEDKYLHFVASTVVAGGAVDVLKFFLEKGMPVNAESYFGSAVDTACAQNKVDIVDVLLDHGLDVNAENGDGETVAFSAMWSSDVRILDRLIMRGANLFHRNKKGENLWSAVIWYCLRGVEEPNFQRLADMRVPLEKEVYDEYFNKFSRSPEIQGILRIMRDTLIRQGDIPPEE